MVLQPIHDIAEICARLGVRNAILSPGSRCAPLILSFARHPLITARTITDERSAAFIGFGMAQKLNRPVVNVCTSGSAVLNFGPAVAEAYYQCVPMVIITADRPPEWTDQQDGQTIRQQNIFGGHVKKSYQLPDHYDNQEVIWHIHRIISEAVNESMEYPAGPVHINVPLREPFYPGQNEELEYSKNLKVAHTIRPQYNLEPESWDVLEKKWSNFKRILIVSGQISYISDEGDLNTIQELSKKLPFVGDVISNLHGVDGIIRYPDIFLMNIREEVAQELKPDLLVTFGKSVISKNLKLFLRKYPAREHWHIQPSGSVADTYKSLTKIIRTEENSFFSKALEWKTGQDNSTYREKWQSVNKKASQIIYDFKSKTEFGEFAAVSLVLEALPGNCNIHLANSMPVRLANIIGLKAEQKHVRVVANRGTSGIDGSNGTAVGEALVSDEQVVLITGDLAFFYDRNAFWHNYNVPNLKIILLNNHAGGIFGMIEGPSALPELGEFFETSNKLSAKNTADDYGFEYNHCSSESGLKTNLLQFFETSSRPSLLEIETSNELNKGIFLEFKNLVKENINK